MTPTTTVLVVEDEDSFVEALEVGLAREGFRVQVARDGAQALAMFDAVAPDLVLLDVMLPKVSGIDVCREIRSRSRVPIIMVTAKGSEIDTVVGLEVGADDYVTKPYRLRELVARMRAVLRRAPGEAEADLEVVTGEAIEVGDVRLDPERHEVTIRGDRVSLPLKEFELLALLLDNAGRVLTRDTLIDRIWGHDYVGDTKTLDVRLDPERHEVTIRGDRVSLPLKEFELLALLLDNAGRVLTRDTLIDRIWGHDYVGDTKTLDVHIKRLRSKVELDPGQPSRIVTIRGLGYKFEQPR